MVILEKAISCRKVHHMEDLEADRHRPLYLAWLASNVVVATEMSVTL